jgi:hypothetical protein
MFDEHTIDDLLGLFAQEPQLSDQLFLVNQAGMDMSMVNFSGDEMHFYITSYGEAADLLVGRLRELRQRGHSPDDFLTFPIMYLYRHQIELLLKLLVRDGSLLAGKPFEGKLGFPKGHHLIKLWNAYRPYLAILHRSYPELQLGETKVVRAVTKLLKEFSDIDPDNEAARYHVGEDNIPSFPKWRYIDIFHYSEVVHKLVAYLYGSATAIAEYMHTKQEMESEMNYEA